MARLTTMQLEQVEVFKALADGTRLRMLDFLILPRSAKQLADLIDDDPHGYFYHLRRLEQAGLVKQVPPPLGADPEIRYYQIDGDRPSFYPPVLAQALDHWAYNLALKSMEDFARYHESATDKAKATRIVATIPDNNMDAAREVVDRHREALIAELAALETPESGATYQVLLLHFPGGTP